MLHFKIETAIVIAILAAAYFNTLLENFLLLVAYWLAPWSVILILEHFIVRGGRYNLDGWNKARHLPVGWAAIISMAIGLLGVYLGAAQTLFVGPIAQLISPPYGIDIGFELGALFAALSYVVLRPLELRKYGR